MTAHVLRSSAISVVQQLSHDGVEVIEERLDDALPVQHADRLIEWAREVSRWQKGHQRVLAVDTTRRTVRFAAEGPLLLGSQLAHAFSSLERAFPLQLWLSVAQSWGKAVRDQLVAQMIGGVRGQWVVDPDQLAIAGDGRLLFGHARYYSVMDGLRLFTSSDFDPLPSVRHPLQLGLEPRDDGPAAQVKDLAFSLAVLLTGRMPFDGVDDVQRALALARPMKLDGIPASLEAVLGRALHVRRAERFPDVPNFLAALAHAAQVEPLSPARTQEALRAVTTEGEVAERRELLDVACGLRARPAPMTEAQRADARVVARLVERLRTGVPLDAVRAAAEAFDLELSQRRYKKATIDRWVTEARSQYEAQLAAGLGRDTEALERALCALNAAGIVARLGYGWSTRSGLELFADERVELEAAGRVRGLVFCSAQILDEAAADEDLWLTTCHLDDGHEEVQAALRAEGLRVTATATRPDERVCELRLEGFRLWRKTGRAECVGGEPRFGAVATQRALSTAAGVLSLEK